MQELPATQYLVDQLVLSYDVARNYDLTWIAGVTAGSIRAAHDPATGTDYAWAGFDASPTAPSQVATGLQGRGSRTAFKRSGTGIFQIYDICTTPSFVSFIGGVPSGLGNC